MAGCAADHGENSEPLSAASASTAPNDFSSLLIHIGYHKTGTTFLQSGLFATAEAGFVSPWLQSDLRDWLVLCSDFDWDATAVRRRLEPDLPAPAQNLVAVLSDERLSGSAHAGGYDSARIAHRLAEVAPGARVLIGIREQVDAICSTYQQYVRNGGSAPIEKYMQPRHQAEVPQFRLDHWRYDRLIGLYQQLFGPERVLVMPFEQLRRHGNEYMATVQEFAGLPPVTVKTGARYPSLSPASIEVKRHANRLLFRGGLNPAAPLYVKNLEERFERIDHMWPKALSERLQHRVPRFVTQQAAGFFKESNLRTQTLAGLNLESFGYETR